MRDRGDGGPAVEVRNLRRVYRVKAGERVALDSVSFSVEQGELFGILGPNGAGKTTLVRVLSTLLHPTSGTARVLGLDVVGGQRQLRRRIGILFGGERGLYTRVTARQNLRYFAGLYGIPRRTADPRIDRLLHDVGLADRADEKVETYSRGMKQRLHLARVLVHDPDIVFLDEPTIGLDPIVAREVRRLITGLPQRGKTVLLTSHYMFEAEALCRRVMVVDSGHVVALDTPEALRRGHPDMACVDVDLLESAPDVEARMRRLVGAEGAVSLRTEGERQILTVQSTKGADLVPELHHALADCRLGVVSVREPTLEDVYVRLVSESRHGAAGRAPERTGR
ncbi:ABC transporter ATP-binding protein [Streptomyces sp. NPDC005760]|uniref:ABC transporter ATP-binding protein n=1 Tax=Streptomyces sp. NPDC005760 TaxID=3156718 RepID=UPI0034014B9F